jgi:ribonuclease HII
MSQSPSLTFTSLPKPLRDKGQFIKSLQLGKIVKLPPKLWALTHRTLPQGGLLPLPADFFVLLDFLIRSEKQSNTSSGGTTDCEHGTIYKWCDKQNAEGFIGLLLPSHDRLEFTPTHCYYIKGLDTVQAYPIGESLAPVIQSILTDTCLKFKGGGKVSRIPATGTEEAKFTTKYIIGVDETARGSLAGPFVACATVWESGSVHPNFEFAQDSKGITNAEQPVLAAKLAILPHAVGTVSVEEMNTAGDNGKPMNLNLANQLAFERALEGIDPAIRAQATILIDGSAVTVSQESAIGPIFQVVQGEATSKTIAAASIIAKHTFDTYMLEQHEAYPAWCFDQHKGYPNPLHLKLLPELGITPLHRLGFKPVRINAQVAASQPTS